MKRDTVVNIFLIIVGILLALALFVAGAVWKGRMKANRPSASAPAAEKDRSLARKKLNLEESMPESENVASARPDCEPLAPAQGLNRRNLRSPIVAKPHFSLLELRIVVNQLLRVP